MKKVSKWCFAISGIVAVGTIASSTIICVNNNNNQQIINKNSTKLENKSLTRATPASVSLKPNTDYSPTSGSDGYVKVQISNNTTQAADYVVENLAKQNSNPTYSFLTENNGKSAVVLINPDDKYLWLDFSTLKATAFNSSFPSDATIKWTLSTTGNKFWKAGSSGCDFWNDTDFNTVQPGTGVPPISLYYAIYDNTNTVIGNGTLAISVSKKYDLGLKPNQNFSDVNNPSGYVNVQISNTGTNSSDYTSMNSQVTSTSQLYKFETTNNRNVVNLEIKPNDKYLWLDFRNLNINATNKGNYVPSSPHQLKWELNSECDTNFWKIGQNKTDPWNQTPFTDPSVKTIPPLLVDYYIETHVGQKILSAVETLKINIINNRASIPTTVTSNADQFIDYNNPSYNEFKNNALNEFKWKRLAGRNSLLNVNIATDTNGQKKLIKILKTNVVTNQNNTTGFMTPSIETIDLASLNITQIANNPITELYYSGGIYSESIHKFVLAISCKTTLGWTPIIVYIDDANQFSYQVDTNNIAQVAGIDATTGSSTNNATMALPTTFFNNFNPEFRIVEFQKPASSSIDPTFLLYAYFPTDWKLNFLDINANINATSNTCDNIYQTCFQYTNNQTSWKPNLLKNKSLYEYLHKYNWDNQIIAITPLFVDNNLTHAAIVMQQVGYDNKKDANFAEVFFMQNTYDQNTNWPGLKSFANAYNVDANNNVEKTISPLPRIESLDTDKTTANTNSSICNTPDSDYYTIDTKGDIIFSDSAHLNGWDYGFVYSYFLCANISGGYQSAYYNFASAIAVNGNNYDVFVNKDSADLSFNLQCAVDFDIMSSYLDIKRKQLYFYSNYTNLPGWSNPYLKKTPTIVKLDFSGTSTTSKYIFDYTLPAKATNPTFNAIDHNFKTIVENNLANFSILNDVNQTISYTSSNTANQIQYIVEPQILVLSSNEDIGLTIPGRKSTMTLKTFFNQKTVDLRKGNFGSFTSSMNASTVTQSMLENEIKTNLENLFDIGIIPISDPKNNYWAAGTVTDNLKKFKDAFIKSISCKLIRNANGVVEFSINANPINDAKYNSISSTNGSNPIVNQNGSTIFKIIGFADYKELTPTTFAQKLDDYNLIPNYNANMLASSYTQTDFEKDYSPLKNKVIVTGDLPANATITVSSFDNSSLASSGQIKVGITVSDYIDSNGQAAGVAKVLNYTISGFKTNSTTATQTTIKLNTISWNEPIFKSIFSSAFVEDWTNNKTILEKDFMTNANNQSIIEQLFNNYTNSSNTSEITKIISATITTANITTHEASMDIKFSGYDQNGVWNSNNNATINFKLNWLANLSVNILNGFQSYLQNWINTANNKRFPTSSQLTQVVTDFLNQKNISSELPLAYKINRQIMISYNAIVQDNTSTIQINKGIIKLIPDQQSQLQPIEFPACTINVEPQSIITITNNNNDQWIIWLVIILVGLGAIATIIGLTIWCASNKNRKNRYEYLVQDRE